MIEVACQHLIADRLGSTRWGLAEAEAILKLGAVSSNGDFDSYFRYHITRQHQSVYREKCTLQRD
ncbi:hypothetical protein [Streptomyces sp. NBC_01233]|uniref:hypothetical protein n=1 Tax=Streptomyces sp. NBC_01233 TaxID=2903787 RepID=UPI002E11B1D1|nr:hypothetical protein OG332_41810 [Streptomyces sp. NBC_01233]